MATGAIVSDEEWQALHDPRLHVETLTRLGTRRLGAGDAFGAFIFADRRCRVATVQAHDLILRSEALRRLGFPGAADSDLARAVDLDPIDGLVTRRLIDVGGEAADTAARWVLADPRSSKGLVDLAARHLLQSGLRVIGSIVVDQDRMTGWVSWHGQRVYALRIETPLGQHFLRLPPRATDAASETIPAPASLSLTLPGAFLGLTVTSDERPFAQSYIAVRVNPLAESRATRRAVAVSEPAPDRAERLVTVIVPVYDDVEITRACLTSLAAQQAEGLVIKVVLVNDAAPAPAMTALLADMSERHGFDLIVNRRNLGFIGAVNRALERVTSGDVVLLNADVMLPTRAIAKLAVAAHAQSGVGIVNPLTNNGQFNSFPAMFGANPLENQPRIEAIDAIAERVASGRLVETPGGIGYCMYVTRACLDAVGAVPEIYLRGYYEDVEFCLRAREQGFATVCAPSIYVGHKGSVSFKDEKQRLVARNERVNDTRFPQHAPSCRAFRRADPLRAIRAAIEAEAFPTATVDVVVAGSALYASVLRSRAEALAQTDATAAILSWSPINGAVVAEIRLHDDGVARQATYRLDGGREHAALLAAVMALGPGRIELAGAPGLFGATLDALRRQGVAFGALLCESNGRSPTLDQVCPLLEVDDPCAACVANFDDRWMPQGVGVPLYDALVDDAPAPTLFVPMDAMAQELATDLESDGFSGSRFERYRPADTPGPHPEASARVARGIVALPYAEPDGPTERLVAALAAAARSRGLPWSFALLGSALDDRRLMSVGNVFVTGPMTETDYDDALLHYGASAVLAPHRWSGFGPLSALAATFALPKAYFDWSIGAVPAKGSDLAIDPRVCDAKAADAICRWLGTLPVSGGRPS